MSQEVLTAEVITTISPERYGEVALQEIKKHLESAKSELAKAKGVVVKTDDDYRQADADMARIKAAMKKFEDFRDSLVRPFNSVVGLVNAAAKDVKNCHQAALDARREPMTAYQTELARQRAEAEAAARKEQQRLEAEAKAKADAEIAAAKLAREEADKARAAAESDDPFAAVLAEEAALEAEARANEQAEAARAAVREMATVEVVPENVAPKVTGSASKTFTVWTYEVEDEALVPMAYRPIDHAALARDVKAGKGECKIPGVRVFSKIEVK